MGVFSSIGGILGGVAGSFFGPLGTVIGSGLGGSVGGAIDANGANKKAQGYYNQQMDFAKQQAQFQQDYAKNVMQWRVEDAKNAGVHPMAALGISNPSYSPVSAPSAPSVYDSGQFDTGSTFGQSLNRASMQAKTIEQQEQAASLGFQQISLQNKGLELDNQYKSLQIAQLASELQRNAASSAPAPSLTGQVPGGIDSQTDSQGLYLDKPIVRDGWVLDERGRKVGIIPSEDAAQRFEDKLVLEWIPFAGSAVRGFRGKFLGQEVNGHWWHGDDKGFLPYPPKKGKSYGDHVSDVMRFYSNFDD